MSEKNEIFRHDSEDFAPSPVSETEYLQAKAKQSEYVNDFGALLLGELMKPGADTIFISPLSIHTALMMTGSGATSITLEAMRQTLQLTCFPSDITFTQIEGTIYHFERKCRSAYTVANSLWLNSTFDVFPTFITNCGTSFGAKAEVISFSDSQTLLKINDWVKNQTKGLIPTILDNVDSRSEMILLNAIHFKGTFSKQFSTSATVETDFTLLNGEKIKCNMMNQTNDFLFASEEDASFVSLGFEEDIQMMIMLPKELGEVALHACTSKYTRSGAFRDIKARLSSRKVALSLPRFEASFSASLKDSLAEVGMAQCFSDAAQFGGISKSRVKLSDVVHKTVLKVDEFGVEAAAATAVVVPRSFELPGASSPPVPFVVDRPFVLVVYERENVAVFSGVITDVS